MNRHNIYTPELEALLPTCKSAVGRKYIEESIRCYRAGAVRSSIISCWLAIVYDFIDKLKDLEFHGDKQAQNHLKNYKQYNENNQISARLDFERDVLEMSLEFEFISTQEKLDLDRIREDRNRCAHPGYTMEDSSYDPTLEMARAHIVNAVELFLKHSAAYGRSTLDKIITEIKEREFSEDIKDYRRFIKNSVLKNPKDVLLRNLVVVCLKKLLNDDEDERWGKLIIGLFKEHRVKVAEIFSHEFSHDAITRLLERCVSGKKEDKMLCLISHDLDFFDCLPEGFQKSLLAEYKYCISEEKKYFSSSGLTAEDLARMTNHGQFKKIVDENFSELGAFFLAELSHKTDDPKYLNCLVNKYINSPSDDDTLRLGMAIIHLLHKLSKPQIFDIFKAYTTNDQIKDSVFSGLVVSAIYKSDLLTQEEKDAIVEKYDLKESLLPEFLMEKKD